MHSDTVPTRHDNGIRRGFDEIEGSGAGLIRHPRAAHRVEHDCAARLQGRARIRVARILCGGTVQDHGEPRGILRRRKPGTVRAPIPDTDDTWIRLRPPRAGPIPGTRRILITDGEEAG
ncbi:hypothetical protein [Leucobacter insecticola]|uniref:hypothetical protein n=1 Tax=Leucobacter insecticola TaxID=2714934 RepID=UPI001FCB9FB4|nr:hypothetical protein [Leucobacter insecticola]